MATLARTPQLLVDDQAEADRLVDEFVAALKSALHTGDSTDLRACFRDKSKVLVPTMLEVVCSATISELHRVKTRVAELEQREYQGVWRADRPYAKHAMVTHAGSTWHSNLDGNRSRPGEPPYDHWTLSVKRGQDGKPGKDCKCPHCRGEAVHS